MREAQAMMRAAQRRSQYNPMLETISAAKDQVIGWVSDNRRSGSHFRQKILELRPAAAKR